MPHDDLGLDPDLVEETTSSFYETRSSTEPYSVSAPSVDDAFQQITQRWKETVLGLSYVEGEIRRLELDGESLLMCHALVPAAGGQVTMRFRAGKSSGGIVAGTVDIEQEIYPELTTGQVLAERTWLITKTIVGISATVALVIIATIYAYILFYGLIIAVGLWAINSVLEYAADRTRTAEYAGLRAGFLERQESFMTQLRRLAAIPE